MNFPHTRLIIKPHVNPKVKNLTYLLGYHQYLVVSLNVSLTSFLSQLLMVVV